MVDKEKVSDILNIDAPPVVEKSIAKAETVSGEIIESPSEKPENKDAETDYREVRRNLKDAISVSKEALDNIMSLATASDSARVYEVVADLLRTTMDANQRLMELHKNIQEIKDGGGAKKSGDHVENITNQVFFAGNSTDLLKMIKDNKKAMGAVVRNIDQEQAEVHKNNSELK